MTQSASLTEIQQVDRLRQNLLGKGYAPVPVKTRQKKPEGLQWQIKAQARTFSPTSPASMNTGVLCAGLRVLDIDVDDEKAADEIFDTSIEMLGSGPVRIRSDSPRKLIVYQAETGEPKKRALVSNTLRNNDGKWSKVEVLGHGQQFVAYGTHPDGAEYEWVNSELFDYKKSELPVIDEDTISTFFEAIQNILGVVQIEARKVQDTNVIMSENHNYGSSETSIEEVEELLTYIPPTCDYDQWLKILQAIHDVTGGSQTGLELAIQWSYPGWNSKQSQFKTVDQEVTSKWKSFRSRGITIATIAEIAGQHGADLSAIAGKYMSLLNPVNQEEANRISAALMESFKKKTAEKNSTELPEITADSFFGKEVPIRKFHDAKGLIPCQGVTLLYGDGGTGKSLLALQLAAATSARKTWLGTHLQHGPVYYFSAEDPIDEAHIRLDAINNTLGSSLKDMAGLHIAPMVGHECVLAGDNGKGIIKPTDVFEAFQKRVRAIQPVLVIIDNAIDVFAGDQNSGPQVKQFMHLLSGVSIENSCPILLLAHPSKSGMNNGTGDGGSVHWSNSARSRLYLTRVHTADENNLIIEEDPCARRLSNMKANYSPTGIEIKMRWENGCFAHEQIDHPDPSDKFGTALKAERVFMHLLEWHLRKNLIVSPYEGKNYAPFVFATHPQSERVSKKQFKDAMNSLLNLNKIENVEYGPPSRKRTKIEFKKEAE